MSRLTNAAELPPYDGSFRARCAHTTFLSRLARVGGRASLLPGPRPTAAGLEKHATRFGPEQVAETAAQLGIPVGVTRARRARKPRGPGLRKRVAALVADGHSVDTIAEMEDLSPARARRIVAEVSP